MSMIISLKMYKKMKMMEMEMLMILKVSGREKNFMINKDQETSLKFPKLLNNTIKALSIKIDHLKK